MKKNLLCDYQDSDDVANIALKLGKENRRRVSRLEDMLFKRGAMNEAPCFCCGYNGPGYYQPEIHPCAKRHHELCKT